MSWASHSVYSDSKTGCYGANTEYTNAPSVQRHWKKRLIKRPLTSRRYSFSPSALLVYLLALLHTILTQSTGLRPRQSQIQLHLLHLRPSGKTLHNLRRHLAKSMVPRRFLHGLVRSSPFLRRNNTLAPLLLFLRTHRYNHRITAFLLPQLCFGGGIRVQ